MLTDQSLEAFRNLYFQEYGAWLSDEESFELASNLINLYRAVYLGRSQKSDRKHETKLQHTHHQG